MNENQGELFQKLVEATKLIRETCKSQQKCDDCPLSTLGYNCAITREWPRAWEFASDESVKKRIIF